MTSRTMLIQQGTYSEDSNRRIIERRTLLDTKEAMARQLIELFELNEETPQEWNDCGDCLRVSAEYAEAIYWYETTLTMYEKLKPLYSSNLREPRWLGTSFNEEYDEKNSRYSTPLSINYDDWDFACDLSVFTCGWEQSVVKQIQKNFADDMHYRTLPTLDKNKRIKEQWERYESKGQVYGTWVIQAMHDLGLFKKYYDYCKDVMELKDARVGNIRFDTGGRTYYGSITVQVIELPSSFFSSRMGKLNETLNEQRDRKDKQAYDKWEADYDTPKAKAEREADAEEQRDLNTFMGESGYTSFARNDDGTTSVWR